MLLWGSPLRFPPGVEGRAGSLPALCSGKVLCLSLSPPKPSRALLCNQPFLQAVPWELITVLIFTSSSLPPPSPRLCFACRLSVQDGGRHRKLTFGALLLPHQANSTGRVWSKSLAAPNV